MPWGKYRIRLCDLEGAKGEMRKMRRTGSTLGVVGAAVCLLLGAGCFDEEVTSVYNIVNDYEPPAPPDLSTATFVGTDTCMTCHPRHFGEHGRSGHNYKLNEVEGDVAPTYPFSVIAATGPGDTVVGESIGFDEISYVVGGYGWKARYLATDGYILTDERIDAELGGVDGLGQYNLANVIVGAVAGWSSYSDAGAGSTGKPYDCGRCHTTGWQAGVNPDHAGILGTWDATGIQCERCHGDASFHVQAGLTDAERRARIVVDSSASLCGECHVRNTALWNGVPAVEASGGFIRHHEQYEELQASGAHANLECVSCHEPHRSTLNENGSGCYASACHTTGATAIGSGHFGKTFSRTGYSEDVTCVSCHMPFASKSAVAATDTTIIGDGTSVTDAIGRIGDLHTHIFSIDTTDAAYDTMIDSTTDPFSNGKAYVDTTGGEAAVTMDFACLRCHNDGSSISTPAYKFSVATAAKFAPAMHKGHFDSGDSSPFRLHGDPLTHGGCVWCHGGQAGFDQALAGGTAVTGDLTFTNGSKDVVGQTGVSQFTTELVAGDAIRLDADGAWYNISSITDDENLVLSYWYAAPAAATGTGSFLTEVPSSRGLTCNTCHDDIVNGTTRRTVASVTSPNGLVVNVDPDSNICLTCHIGRRPMPDYIDGDIADSDFGLNRPHHHGVGYALLGSDAGGGYEYGGKTYEPTWTHFGAGGSNSCVYCHKAGATGHTFDVSLVFTASCAGCHTEATAVEEIRKVTDDYDNDGDFAEPTEDEIDGLKAALSDALNAYAVANTLPLLAYSPTSRRWFYDPDGDGVVTDTSRGNRYDDWDGPMMRAAYNYAMAGYRVPGSWAHNSLYVAQLLVDSIEDLGTDVSGYTWR